MKCAYLVAVLAGLFIVPAGAVAAPVFSLANSSGHTSATIPTGTGTYSLDLFLNTDGHAVSALQYYLQATPAESVHYASTPITVIGDTFAAGDLWRKPNAGAVLKSGLGYSTIFVVEGDDYAAFSGAIARYTFDTSLLAAGTYTITPIGEEMTNSTEDTIDTFATPAAFTLTVASPTVPEPAALSGLLLAGMLLLRRRV